MSSTMPVCPICDAGVVLPANAALSELIPCPECGCELEIESLEPLRLAQAPSEEEDWGE
jgi:alpha-aminoadipate carrier protein LysW